MGRRKKRTSISSTVAVIITLLAVADVVILAKIFGQQMPKDYSAEAFATAENVSSEIADKYTSQSVTLADVHAGNLILVNDAYAYEFDNTPSAIPTDEIVTVESFKNEAYFVKDDTIYLSNTTVNALNAMMSDYFSSTGKTDVMVCDGYRTREEQQMMVDRKVAEYGETQTIAMPVGNSEHHAGLAFDFSTYTNGVWGDFDLQGDLVWFLNNAHRYGFILRYPADKESITHISYEPWHFRYVGLPHAEYMKANNLCLEEYIASLASYSIDNPLKISCDSDGKTYLVYAQSVDELSQSVRVPSSGAFTLTGDNISHIIVTEEQ